MMYALIGSNGIRILAGCAMLGLLLCGCASPDPENGMQERSPTAALLRGDIATDEYLASIRRANEITRAQAQFEMNRDPVRAYNTKTKRIEYVPRDSQQTWNEAMQRWEFTPPD